MKKIVVIILFSLFHFSGNAQSKFSLLNEGHYYFELQDYFSAIYFYELALQKDSTIDEIWNPLAQSYRMTYQYSKAIRYYNKVLNLNQDHKYPNTLLFLGMLHKNISEYQKASELLHQFLDQHPSPSDYWYRKGLMELKGSELALNSKEDNQYTIRHLDNNINTAVSDFAPFVNTKGELYYSSMDQDDGLATEVYLGHRSRLKVSDNEEAFRPYYVFNDLDVHIANLSFNEEGTKAFFSKCKNRQNQLWCQVYSSHLVDGLWQEAQLMDQRFNPLNSQNTQPQWGLWQGQEGLFISSDRKGGLGLLDLWFIPFKGSPKHLGNGINTSGNEVSPFYHSYEQVLYFSSDFHPGYGGYDLFFSTWKNGGWSKVQNLNTPLNSAANDLYYVSRLDSPQLGYFSSNRIGSKSISFESCCNDIYAFHKTTKCSCIEKDSLEQAIRLQLPLSLYFHNDEPNPKSRDSTTTLGYDQTFPSYMDLKTLYVKQFSSVLAGRSKNQAEIQMGEFFDLTVSQGFDQLRLFAIQLENLLSLNAKVEIGIKGFTSPLNDSDYNYLLAKRRIMSVKNYLLRSNNSILKKYVENGTLIFVELPLGETQVNTEVSDNPNDRRNSVYSVKAARERRIEIQSITVEF